MPKSLPVLLAAILLAVGCSGPDTTVRGDAPPVGAGKGKLSDVRDAEDEGETHAVAPPPERRAPVFSGSVPGSSERECVALPEKGVRRSGEFATDLLYLHEGPGGWGAKMPWSPLHLREEYFANDGDVRGVTVRTASLRRPREIRTQRFERTTGFVALGEVYPSYVRLPSEGPWRLIATSGSDWGCFDLEAGASVARAGTGET